MTRRRTLPRAVAALLTCAALVLSGCSSGGSGGKDFRFTSKTKLGTVLPVGNRKPAQDFSGDLLSGGRISLRASKGHVTVVNFWASWCGPCKVETPQLDLLYRKVKSEGVHFIGVDTKDDKGNAKIFISHNDISFPVIYDQQARTQLALGNIPGVLPFTVLIDKAGRVAAVYLQKLTPKDLQGPIRTLLSES